MRSISKLRQAGFMLIELSLAFALLSMMLFYQVRQERDQLVEDYGEAHGRQMKTVADAANAYAVTYYNQVLNNTAVTGVAVTLQPTVAELATLGFLSAGYGSTTMFGGGYNIVLTLTPAACTLPNCNIAGYVNTTQPILVDAVVSAKAIGKALGEIGPDGGAAQIAGATINGMNGGWSMVNPVAGQPRGIMAVRLGAGSLAFAQFLRRDGSLPMTGNLDMGGQNVTNAALMAFSATQTAGNACTTGQVGRDATGELMACVSGAWKQAGGGKWKDPVASMAALNALGCNAASSGDVRIALAPSVGTGPRPYMCNGAGTWQALVLDDSGNITIPGQLMVGDGTAATASNTLVVNRTATENGACSPNGAVARDATGLILSCQSGVWMKQGAGSQVLSGSFALATNTGSYNNGFCSTSATVTYSGTCSSGVKSVVVTADSNGLTGGFYGAYLGVTWFNNSQFAVSGSTAYGCQYYGTSTGPLSGKYVATCN